MIESAKLQDPRSPKFSLPPISMVEIVQYKEERKRKQLAKQKISKKKGIHDLHEEKFQDNKNSSSISDGSINDVVIVWFRQDFRIFDNPALYEAAKTGKKLVCVYIHPSTEEEGQRGDKSEDHLQDRSEQVDGQTALEEMPRWV